MQASSFLTDKEIDTIFQIRNSATEYSILLDKWVRSGMPYNEHLQKAQEQLAWIETLISTFELVERT